MTIQPIQPGTPNGRLIIDGHSVVINEYEIESRDLVDFLLSQETPEKGFAQLVDTAIRIISLANSSAEAENLRNSMERLGQSVDEAQEKTKEQVRQVVSDFFDPEEGKAAKSLGSFRNSLDDMLQAKFDPDSRASILSKFDDQIAKTFTGKIHEINQILDINSEDGVLHKMRTNFVDDVKASVEPIQKQINDVLERLGAKDGAKKERLNSAHKGGDFNKYMDDLVQAQAAKFSDFAQFTDAIASESGSKVGDEVVEIRNDSTGGRDRRIVWEFKTEAGKQSQTTSKKFLDELDVAMKNRNAQVAIGVYDLNETTKDLPRFQEFGANKAIIVIDNGDEGDDQVNAIVVQMAYVWARWTAVREFGKSDDHVDYDAIYETIASMNDDLTKIKEIKKGHTGIKTGLEAAQRWLSTFEDSMKDKVERLNELVKDPNEDKA